METIASIFLAILLVGVLIIIVFVAFGQLNHSESTEEELRLKHDEMNAEYKRRGIPEMPYPSRYAPPSPPSSIPQPKPNSTKVFR